MIVALPTDVDAERDLTDDRPAGRAARWAWGFTWLGVALRAARFLAGYPLFLDEQWLCLNLIGRDYFGLLDGLEYRQAAPFGFLWLQKAVVEVCGLNEYSLRTAALLAGIGGMFAFRILAGRILRGPALVWAVGIFAVSYFPLRHAAELKPYALDSCAATLLAWCAIEWMRNPGRGRWAIAATIIAAIALPLSYPAAFVAGGVSLALLPVVLRTRSLRTWAHYAAFNLVVLVVFIAIYSATMRTQFDAATKTSFMHDYWAEGFPPLAEPWRLPLWLAEVHAGEGVAYPIGGKRFASLASAVFAVLGAVNLWRTGGRSLVRLTGCVLFVGFVAAVLQRYPYGYGERLQQYWAPFLCLLIGSGWEAGRCRLTSQRARRRAVYLLVCLLLLLGAAFTTESIARPFKHRWDREHRDFARWFWQFASEGTPQICIAGDWRRNIYPGEEHVPYTVHREIYRSSTTDAGGRDDFRSIPAGSPIECVAFSQAGQPRDDGEFIEWQREMAQCGYRLVGYRRYPTMVDDKPGKHVMYHVWRFESDDRRAHPARMTRR